MPRIVKVGLTQVDAVPKEWSVQQRQDKMLEWLESGLRQGADLVFMTEGFQYQEARKQMSPYECANLYGEAFKLRCSELARAYSAYVVPWDFELTKEGKLYNCCYILDRQGQEIGRYRKIHLTWSEQSKGLDPGDSLPVFELDFGRIGIMICFDNYFPESARILALQGAELILYPYFGDTMAEQWEAITKARAFDNTVYVAACCISKSTFTGLIDPLGKVAAKVHQRGSTEVVSIDLDQRAITRTSALPGKYEDFQYYLRRVRMPAAYTLLTEQLPVKSWNEILVEKVETDGADG